MHHFLGNSALEAEGSGYWIDEEAIEARELRRGNWRRGAVNYLTFAGQTERPVISYRLTEDGVLEAVVGDKWRDGGERAGRQATVISYFESMLSTPVARLSGRQRQWAQFTQWAKAPNYGPHGDQPGG